MITVHDTITLLEDFFTSTEHPKVIFERFNQEVLDNSSNVQKPIHVDNPALTVYQAAGLSGFGQQGWGLFNPSRKREISAWIFEQFRERDILSRIDSILHARCVDLDINPDLDVYLFPADPANRSIMIFGHGVIGFGSVPGTLALQFFPSPGNMKRLDAILTRLLIHQLHNLTTLGGWMEAEGMAAELNDDWQSAILAPDDWDDTLQMVADAYNVPAYSAVQHNIYGQQQPVGDYRLPRWQPMDAETRDYTIDLITNALAETNPNRIAAYLYGDEIVAEQGHEGIGLPPYAGFEVAAELETVRTCLKIKH